ncbi:hypothetical protein EDB81DRAFT_772114 [Dactylonectria macrodidyma]|uniref:Uncharacterized protein n=1 Tax=Dactylonectria macrodidyma TaxID=307937 RepID=A0A9P9JNK3_9HYPO|nr:hypothetical protein EDB81DRAFT_772114 [Dactylonectria macrodidyma]
MDMTKFANNEDPGFIALCGELRRWIRSILLQPEERFVNRHESRALSFADRGRQAIVYA